MQDRIRLTRSNILVHELCKDPIRDFDEPRNVGIVVCGNEKHPDVALGDKVFYGETNGYYLELNGEKFCILSYREILGKIIGDCDRESIHVGRYHDIDELIEKMTQSRFLGENPINVCENTFL